MADVFEEEQEQEPTVSMGEYLKEVEEQELEADLVLGGDEGKECTYNKGYMKRQAIFSCLTCTPDGNAGVCTACSLSCHEGHEIVELWTKRNFKCDCGNSKFGEFFCKLFPGKDAENPENSYNHNFKGLYCTCERPYPDPDAEEQVEMIQCCVCEDWFHEEHLGLEPSDEIPKDEGGEPIYEDFICRYCSLACSFLYLYPPSIWAVVREHDVQKSANEKELVENDKPLIVCSKKVENGNCSLETPMSNTKPESVLVGKDILQGESNIEHTLSDQGRQAGGPSNECIIEKNLEAINEVKTSKPMFLLKNWRDSLCRCGKCIESYGQKGVGFLLDPEDSIAEYEKMAKQRRDEKLQQQDGLELNLLSNLGHVEKMEILGGIADMKNEIHSFLESFDRSKPVTSADIHQVFENLAKKRRQM